MQINKISKSLLTAGLLMFANGCFAVSSTTKELLSSWWVDNALLIIILFFLFAAYTTWIIHRKHAQARREIKKLGKYSSVWHLHNIRTRIRDVFSKWFEAHSKNNAEILKDYVSDHLYNHCYLEFSNLADKDIKEVFTPPKLHTYCILSMHSGSEESQDIIWVYLKYAQSEYEVKKNTEELVEGKPGMAPMHKELWKFIRQEHTWVLDSIREKIRLKDIEALINIEE